MEPYSGGREYGSGAIGGAGFGNKSSSGSASDSAYGGNPEVGRNSDPYSGSNEYGSGATGGAGYGNKSSNRDNDDNKKGGMFGAEISDIGEHVADIVLKTDSTSGKMMEKLGGMFGNEKMKEQGRGKREDAGYGDNS